MQPRYIAAVFAVSLAIVVITNAPPPVQAQDISGESVYETRCAACHDNATGRVPNKQSLREIAVANIVRELETGSMAALVPGISPAERTAVAEYLGVAGGTAGAAGLCRDSRAAIATSQPGWNGWSPAVTNTRFQTAERAGLTLEQVRRLKLKWAFGFEGDRIVFAQPALIGGNVFVGSASGRVHALDAATGCTHWVFQADAGVRGAISMARVPRGSGSRNLLLFGDRGGHFYAVAAENGQLIWKVDIDDHPAAHVTGSAVASEGVVYVPVASLEETFARRDGYACCSFRGSILALNIADGSEVWKSYVIEEEPHLVSTSGDGLEHWGPSGAAIWSAPTLDLERGLLYAATGDNYSDPATAMSDAVVAMELATGRIVWVQQTTPGDVFNGRCQSTNTCVGDDYDYGAPVILEQMGDGREILLAGQKSGVVYAMDPDNRGEILWQARVGEGGVNGGIQWGMASDGRNLYVANSDVTRRPGTTYDPTKGGGFAALRITDGQQQWRVEPPPCDDKPGCSPAQSAAVTAIPGVVFSGSLDGHLRAYAAEDGRVIWDFDTARAFATVNGVEASGGGIDGHGPVVAGGMLLVGSGYQRTGGMGGNLLLAFAAAE